MKNLRFEQKINQMLPNWKSFNVQFHDLLFDGESWSVNDSWTPIKDASRDMTIQWLKTRWEVFKLNYLPNAKVKDIEDIGDGDLCCLEVDCTAFATLTKGE
jgi:hypothetical protein